MTHNVLYLSHEDVARAGVFDMGAVIESVEQCLRIHGDGNTVLPPKATLRWGTAESEMTRGRFNALLGYVGPPVDRAGVKWMASMPGNPATRHIPRGIGVLVISDPHSGLPEAIMDATLVSAVRTAAASAVAARTLRRSGSTHLGLIGAGVQNRMAALAIKKAVPEVEAVTVFDAVANKSHEFSVWLARKDASLSVSIAESPEPVLRESHIVHSATTSATPFLEGDWLSLGSLLIEISPWDSKVSVLSAVDRIVVDDWPSLEYYGGYLVVRGLRANSIGLESVQTSLADILVGRARGRATADERILYNAVGLAIYDVAVGSMIVRNARSQGLGVELPFWKTPLWA